MASPFQITSKQLSRLVGTPAAPVLIDVRIEDDIAQDPQGLPASKHCPHNDVPQLAAALSGRRVVVYCQKGLKLSEGAAALLRCSGIEAEVLEVGHFAWRDAGLPLVRKSAPA